MPGDRVGDRMVLQLSYMISQKYESFCFDEGENRLEKSSLSFQLKRETAEEGFRGTNERKGVFPLGNSARERV